MTEILCIKETMSRSASASCGSALFPFRSHLRNADFPAINEIGRFIKIHPLQDTVFSLFFVEIT